jgi:hypothetical protein
MLVNPLSLLAGTMGLEPTTSGVTGRRSKPTELRPRGPFLVGGTGFEPVTFGL